MQLRNIPALFVALFVSFSCTQQSPLTNQQTQNEPENKSTFFPVTEFIKSQLKEIDSLPLTPIKIINYHGKVDSFWMKKEDIRPFAEPFLHPAIDTANFKDLFIQRSFLDQTINAFTFSYDPINKLPDTLQLRRWDVYIDAIKNTITRIYMVKEIGLKGIVPTNQTLQLTWKSNQWCKITAITEQSGKQPDVKEELMKWDFRE